MNTLIRHLLACLAFGILFDHRLNAQSVYAPTRDTIVTLLQVADGQLVGHRAGGVLGTLNTLREAMRLNRQYKRAFTADIAVRMAVSFDEIAYYDSANAYAGFVLSRAIPEDQPSVYVKALLLQATARSFEDPRFNWKLPVREARERASASGDTVLLAWVHERAAMLFTREAPVDSSDVNALRAIELYRQTNDVAGESRVTAFLANAFQVRNRGAEAKQLFAKALARSAGGNAPRVYGLTLFRSGGLLGYGGDLQTATAQLQQAATVYTQIADTAYQSAVFNMISALYARAGRSDSSCAYERRALALTERSGYRRYESITLGNLANCSERLSQISVAVDLWHRSVASAHHQRFLQGQADALQQLSSLYDRLRRTDSAKFYGKLADSVRRQAGARSARSTELARAERLLDDGQLDAATAALRRARLDIERNVASPFYIDDSILLESLTMWLWAAKSKPDSALMASIRWLDASKARPSLRNELQTKTWAGRWALESGRLDSARALLTTVRRASRTVDDPDLQQSVLMLLGMERSARATSATGSGKRRLADDASAYFDSAYALTPRLQRSAGSDANRVALGDVNADLADLWVSARIAADDTLGAFGVSERLRARTMLSARLGTYDTTTGVPATEYGRRVLAAIPTGTLVLAYRFIDDRLTIFIARGRRVTMRQTDASRTRIAQLVTQARQQLGPPGGMIVAKRSAALESDIEATDAVADRGQTATADALKSLATILLPGDLGIGATGQAPLLIVPHESLALVPFAALPVSGLGALTAQAPIRVTPSLFLEKRPGTTAAPLRSLVVGNPAMPAPVGRDGRSVQLLPLPSAEREASAVARLLGTSPLVGEAATEATVRTRMRDVDVIHFATHGMSYSTLSQAGESFVALSASAGFDGLLTANELMTDRDLRLKADLVTLSACETGLGDIRAAEGTIGLQRAWLARGASSLLVSLWSVDDDATRVLMERFYQHWRTDPDKPSKAAALQRAQMDVRRIPAFANPYFWSGFQLVGAE